MAYLDREAETRKKERADKYAELKKHITSNDENGKLKEWLLAYEHMVYMENQIKQQEKEIEEYESFFSLMQKLLPGVPSIYDPIG